MGREVGERSGEHGTGTFEKPLKPKLWFEGKGFKWVFIDFNSCREMEKNLVSDWLIWELVVL